MTRRLVVLMLAACGGSGPRPTPVPAPTAPAAPDGIVVLDATPRDAVVLDVRAVRWVCGITYPNQIVTDELRVPVGRPITLHVWTPEWPQNAAGIEVALVGTPLVKPVVRDQPVDVAFRIDRPGTYAWKCPTLTPPPPKEPLDPAIAQVAIDAQNPVKRLHAIPAAEYDAWLAANDPNRPMTILALGKQVYEKKGCNACHTLDGTPRVGPTWKGIWGTTVTGTDGSSRVVDEAFVAQSLTTPQAFVLQGFPPVMPSFEGQLRAREIAAVTAFIASLK